METAKLFRNGGSQAVRLPKAYCFEGNDVLIQKTGEGVVLFPKNKEWEIFLQGLYGFTDDFLAEGRMQGEPQERAAL